MRPLRVHGILVVAAVLTTGWTWTGCAEGELRAAPCPDQTAAYLQDLDLTGFLRRGGGFEGPTLDLQLVAQRLRTSAEELETGRHYDFDHVEEVEQRLARVDRSRALAAILELVTAGATTNVERHIALAAFVARSIHKGSLTPVHRSGRKVLDPLVLLELGEGDCSRVAGVAVDLWRAGGSNARLVLLGHHVVAELEYDGGWHYLDVDHFGGAEMVRGPDGSIPSLAELGRTPYAIDGPVSFVEPHRGGRVPTHSPRYPSYRYFGRCRECDGPCSPKRYRYKTASAREQQRDPAFGWESEHTRTVRAADIPVSDLPPRFQPGAPRFLGVDVSAPDGQAPRTVTLRWEPPMDRDGDLLGFRVFVSRHSRGWSYGTEGAGPEVLPFWSHPDGWEPGMYERLFELPPSEVALLTVTEKRVVLTLEAGATYHVTVMPYDAHGESVGRTIYRASQELAISL